MYEYYSKLVCLSKSVKVTEIKKDTSLLQICPSFVNYQCIIKVWHVPQKQLRFVMYEYYSKLACLSKHVKVIDI